MTKTRIRFEVSYDGTDFCGWQKQNHGPLKSVQHVIQDALETVFKEKITLFASGRTDAGVHARAQVCHFDVSRSEEAMRRWNLAEALRTHMPATIQIKKVWLAPEDFHSTLSPDCKTYKYFIYNRNVRSVFLHRYAEWIRRPIAIEHLQESSKYLLGEHDFKSFQSVGSDVPHTVRKILQAKWILKRPDILQFTITGNGFLKQMVRNIVGTQLMLERQKQNPEKLNEIMGLKYRKAAGPPAAPQGLYLWKVYYPKELDNRCREL